MTYSPNLLAQVLLVHFHTGSEIDHSDDGILLWGGIQSVLWLEISVDDPLSVAEHNCREHLLHDVTSLSLSEALLLDNLVEELSSRAQLCHNVEVVFILEVLEDVQNMRMVQLPKYVNLGINSRQANFNKRLKIKLLNHSISEQDTNSLVN